MIKRTSQSSYLALLATLLLCAAWAALAAWPAGSARADGGGFPTDTPRPTTTTIFTQPAEKGLSDTSAKATATAQAQQAAGTPGSAPAVSSGQIVPTSASGQTAPVSGDPSGETTQTSSGIPLIAIIGTAILATAGVVGLIFMLRRRQ